MADSSPEEVHVPAEVATGAAAPDVTDLTEQKERDEIVIRPAKQRTSRGSRRGAKATSPVFDAWEVVTENGPAGCKYGRACRACSHIPKAEGGSFTTFPKDLRKDHNPVANKLIAHYNSCPGIELVTLISMVEHGCADQLLQQILEVKMATAGTDIILKAATANAIATPTPKAPSSQQLKQTDIRSGYVRCTANHASSIIFFMTRFILGQALSFATVTSVYFRDMIRQLNLAFYEEYTQKRAYIFSHRYLDLVYNHVVSLVWGALGRGGDLWSLAADGLKGSLGQSLVNFNASRNTDVPRRCAHGKLGASFEHRRHAALIYPVAMLCPRALLGSLPGCSWCNKGPSSFECTTSDPDSKSVSSA